MAFRYRWREGLDFSIHANNVVNFATIFVRNIPYIIQDFKSYSQKHTALLTVFYQHCLLSLNYILNSFKRS